MASITAATPDQLIQISLLGEAAEHAPIAVFVFDDTGRYAAVNDYACRLLGYERQDLLARRIGDLAAGSRDDAIRHYLEVVRGERALGVAVVRTSEGDEVRLRFHARPTTVAGMPFYVAVAWVEA
jgi:PAS domain S-box-containing protein